MTRAQQAMKDAMKEALVDALKDQRDLLQEVFADALEDIAMAKAIEEGRRSRTIKREQVFKILRGSQCK